MQEKEKVAIGVGHGRDVVCLSQAERAALEASAGRGLLQAVVAQAVMGLLATGGAWAIAGPAAGLSALCGAAAYFIPNACFALRLRLTAHRSGRTHFFSFFLGEAFKLTVTVVLLCLIVQAGRQWLVWPAMVIGPLCVLKGYLLLLTLRR